MTNNMTVKIEQNEIIEDAFETALEKLSVLSENKIIPEWKVYNVDNIGKIEKVSNYTLDLHNTEDMSDDPVYRVMVEIYGEEDNKTVEIHLGE